MKSVLISIQPKWCEKICHKIGEENGKPVYEKRIEVRKSKPSEVPFKAYIYETKGATETPWADEDGHLIFKGRRQVIGEFVCDNAEWMSMRDCDKACMTLKEAVDYGKGKKLYGWHISDLVIYDKPKELSEFRKPINCGDYDCWVCHNWDRLNLKCIAMNNELRRPPQSWCYVEELHEEKK